MYKQSRELISIVNSGYHLPEVLVRRLKQQILWDPSNVKIKKDDPSIFKLNNNNIELLIKFSLDVSILQFIINQLIEYIKNNKEVLNILNTANPEWEKSLILAIIDQVYYADNFIRYSDKLNVNEYKKYIMPRIFRGVAELLNLSSKKIPLINLNGLGSLETKLEYEVNHSEILDLYRNNNLNEFLPNSGTDPKKLLINDYEPLHQYILTYISDLMPELQYGEFTFDNPTVLDFSLGDGIIWYEEKTDIDGKPYQYANIAVLDSDLVTKDSLMVSLIYKPQVLGQNEISLDYISDKPIKDLYRIYANTDIVIHEKLNVFKDILLGFWTGAGTGIDTDEDEINNRDEF